MSFKTTILAAAATALFATSATAATVTYSQTQSLTSAGQDLAFDFTGLDASDGTGGTLTLVGNTLDLGSASSEYMDISIESVGFGRWSCGGNGTGSTNIPGWVDNVSFFANGSRCAFSLNITVSGAQLDTFLTDGTVSILAAMGSGVSVLGGPSDNLTASLTYDTAVVPVPASGAFLLTGLIAVAVMRRRPA